MEQKSFPHQAPALIRKQRRRRRWQKAVTGMAAVVVFVTTYLLILPAITMQRNLLNLETELPYAALGDAILVDVSAEADSGQAETIFFLSADGDNAGLDESRVSFDEDGVALLADQDGRGIELHREYENDGAVNYWFSLPESETSHFALPWVNGVERLIQVERPEEPEISETPSEMPQPTDTPPAEEPKPSAPDATPAPEMPEGIDTPDIPQEPGESELEQPEEPEGTTSSESAPPDETPEPPSTPDGDDPSDPEEVITPTEEPAAESAPQEPPAVSEPSGGEISVGTPPQATAKTQIEPVAATLAMRDRDWPVLGMAAHMPIAPEVRQMSMEAASIPLEGDPNRKGELTISFGSGSDLEEARASAEREKNRLTLNWLTQEELEEMNPRVTLTAQAGDVTVVTAAAPGVLPEGTSLVVTPLEWEETDLLALEPGQTAPEILAVHLYDISFVDGDGQMVEPEGNVSVTMTFHEPVARAENGARDSGGNSRWELVHISDDLDVERLSQKESTQIRTNDENAVERVEFQSSDFSIYALLERAHETLEEEPQSIVQYIGTLSEASVDIIISDKNYNAIEPDEDGIYHVKEDEDYFVQLQIASKTKIDPGLYYYSFPAGQTIQAEGGKLMLYDTNTGKQVEVGEWYFDSETNRLMLHFLEAITDFTNLTLSATVQVTFVASEEQLEFDGNIHVQVDPGEKRKETELSKRSASGGSSPEPGKIYWKVKIIGHENSQIPGSVLEDTILTDLTHHYTKDDMGEGIEFKAARYDNDSAEGEPLEEHEWTITRGDDELDWSETGWSYTMPEKITCEDCGKEITLGNENWVYTAEYTSTALKDEDHGYIKYENKVTIDGQEDEGRKTVGGEESGANIIKKGVYHSAGNDGTAQDTIRWTVTAEIPGAGGSGKYDYFWYINDGMVLKQGDHEQDWFNDADKAEVTAVIGGKTYQVPKRENATENDPICWEVGYSSGSHAIKDEDGNIIGYGSHQIYLWSRCKCTEETCQNWDEDDDACNRVRNGFCQCWCITEDTTLTFAYETSAEELIETYGGRNAMLENSVTLNSKVPDPSKPGDFLTKKHDDDFDDVVIPGVFVKSNTDMPDKDNGLIAEFAITVNETKKDLSENYKELTIEDTMSETLIFIGTTLVITAEDASGEQQVLTKEEDYTVAWDGVNHKIKIVLKKPGPYKYTLLYKAAIQVPAGSTNLTYSNEAKIDLFGKEHTSSTKPTIVPDIVATGENYSLSIWKTEPVSAEGTYTPVVGAVFGLYDGNDQKVGEYTTKDDGSFTVKTDTQQGIYFYEHAPFYFVEEQAPEGYINDQKKHYFWFCNLEEGKPCNTCDDYISLYDSEENGSCAHPVQSANTQTQNWIQVFNRKIDGFKVYKVSSYNPEKYLTGAEFTLYEDDVCTKEIAKGKLVEGEDGIPYYSFGGLQLNQTYYLKETKAPDGFILDDTVYTVFIAADGTVSATANGEPVKSENNGLTVENAPSLVLPETGGTGTLPLTTGGLILLILACLMYRYQKRRKEGCGS